MIFPGGTDLIGEMVTVRADEAFLWGFTSKAGASRATCRNGGAE